MLKLGLIGVGIMGRRYIKSSSTDPNAEMVAICDLNLDAAKNVASEFAIPGAYGSVDEMLERADLNAVIVATPDFAHRVPACKCLEAGLDVFCEKPLSISVDDGCEILKTVRKTGRKFMVNFGNRHRLSVRRMQTALRGGSLGELRYAHMVLNEKSVKLATLPWAAQTSPLWFLLSHVTDFVTWVINQPVVRVYAADGRLASNTEQLSTAGILTFENGATATIQSSWNMPEHHPRDIDMRVALHGSDGVIEMDMGQQGLVISDNAISSSVPWDVTADESDPDDWWNRSCHYFTRCVANDVAPTPDCESGLRTTLTLAALQHSLDTGQAVTIAELFPEAHEILNQ